MSDKQDLDNFNLSSFLDEASAPVAAESVLKVALSSIEADPDQVRSASNEGFSADELNELADSIRESGLIQPIVVRRTDKDRYMVVVGERRYRACKLAGLKEIPVIVRDYDTENGLIKRQVDQLVENYQRRDLDNFEIAASVRSLIESGGFRPSELGRRLGMSSEKISMYLRLAECPEFLVSLYREGSLSKSLRFLYDLIDFYRQHTELTSRFIAEVLETKQVFDSRDLKDLREMAKNRDRADEAETDAAGAEYVSELSSEEGQDDDDGSGDSQPEAESDDGFSSDSDDDQTEAFQGDTSADSDSGYDGYSSDVQTGGQDAEPFAHDREQYQPYEDNLQDAESSFDDAESDPDEEELTECDPDETADLESSDEEIEDGNEPFAEEKELTGFKVEYNGAQYVLRFEDLKRVDCNRAIIRAEGSDEETEADLPDLHLISYFSE